MTDSLIRDLNALKAGGFTGTLTLHFESGTVKKCEKLDVWKPNADGGPVHLSEGKGEGVDSGHG